MQIRFLLNVSWFLVKYAAMSFYNSPWSWIRFFLELLIIIPISITLFCVLTTIMFGDWVIRVVLQFYRERGLRRRSRWTFRQKLMEIGIDCLKQQCNDLVSVTLRLYRRFSGDEELSRILAFVNSIFEPRPARTPGLTPETIALLPVSTVSEVTTHECSICLAVMEVGTKVRRLLCLHAFHVGYIDTWLERKGTCPVDNTKVFDSIVSSARQANQSGNLNEQYTDLIERDYEDDSLTHPSARTELDTAEETRAALEKLVEGKIAAARP
eukprot:446515_1